MSERQYYPDQPFEKKSEMKDKSEALLDMDAKEWMKSGQVKTKEQLEELAYGHGWRNKTDKKIIDHIAQKKGLK